MIGFYTHLKTMLIDYIMLKLATLFGDSFEEFKRESCENCSVMREARENNKVKPQLSYCYSNIFASLPLYWTFS